MRWIGISILTWATLGQAHAQQLGDAYDNGSQVRIGQYTTQSVKPSVDVVQPLEVFVQLNFPRQSVKTIGDAVQYTLMRTGWSLDTATLAPQALEFLALPLPESQRTLDTYRVRDVLQTLMGTTWLWQEDPVRRSLWFVLTPTGQSLPQLQGQLQTRAQVPPSLPVPLPLLSSQTLQSRDVVRGARP